MPNLQTAFTLRSYHFIIRQTHAAVKNRGRTIKEGKTMKDRTLIIISTIIVMAMMMISLQGCLPASSGRDTPVSQEVSAAESPEKNSSAEITADSSALSQAVQSYEKIILETDSELFTERDLTQNADMSQAETVTAADDSTVTLTEEGIYLLTGTAENFTVIVDTDSEAKVQLVLDGLNVTNDDFPVVYVKSADKVFLTSSGAESTLTVSGSFTADGTTNTDAVIFSRDDLVLKGTGTVNISSTSNGISTKDDLKVTGGVWNIDCEDDALEANDSIAVAGGAVSIVSAKDGLHAENDEDDTVGWISIEGGTITVRAGDDAVHATTVASVSGGTLDLTAGEGIEATQVEISGGDISISASDDGINAGRKSDSMSVGITISGGSVYIEMGPGDTDGVDSNGYLTISGGTLDIYAQSPFDADGSVSWTGGTIYVNGSQASSINTQMMGGGKGGRW